MEVKTKALEFDVKHGVLNCLYSKDEELAGSPDTMDQECIKLCDAINKLPGITTIESCCGHGKTPFRIWFVTANVESLPPLLYWMDG